MINRSQEGLRPYVTGKGNQVPNPIYHPRICSGGTAVLARAREHLTSAIMRLDDAVAREWGQLAPEAQASFRLSCHKLVANLSSLPIDPAHPLEAALLAELASVLHDVSTELWRSAANLETTGALLSHTEGPVAGDAI